MAFQGKSLIWDIFFTKKLQTLVISYNNVTDEVKSNNKLFLRIFTICCTDGRYKLFKKILLSSALRKFSVRTVYLC